MKIFLLLFLLILAPAFSEEHTNAMLFPNLIYHSGADHYAVNVSPMGDIIELQDGSVWQISEEDRKIVKEWLRSDTLNLIPNDNWFSSYDYQLKNLITLTNARVNLFLPPLLDSPYTYRIQQIDYEQNELTLSDGSDWEMSWFDDKIIAKWKPDDMVILGYNDGWWKSFNPYILLNVHDLRHARGARLR